MRRRDVMAGGLALGGLATAVARAEAPSGDVVRTEHAYDAVVTLAPATPVGDTPKGKRNRIPITGGTFQGPRIKGKVLAGGMDWQLIRADGFLEVYAEYMMQADDGALIHVVNSGLISMRPGTPYVRTTPVFEAPNGPHAWLNEAVFTGTIGAPPKEAGPAVLIRVFKLL